jgi:hypothetical protein
MSTSMNFNTHFQNTQGYHINKKNSRKSYTVLLTTTGKWGGLSTVFRKQWKDVLF